MSNGKDVNRFALCVLNDKGKIKSIRHLHSIWDHTTEQDCKILGVDYKEILAKTIRDELRDEIEIRTVYDMINESEGKKHK